MWYKDRSSISYTSRRSSIPDDDGSGDFQGLCRKLDYLQDLGVTALWLLPFYPRRCATTAMTSPITKNVNPSYGRMADFKNFVRKHIAAICGSSHELIINHTSDQHPWFRRAASGKARLISARFLCVERHGPEISETRIKKTIWYLRVSELRDE